jgi:hypothetical protein
LLIYQQNLKALCIYFKSSQAVAHRPDALRNLSLLPSSAHHLLRSSLLFSLYCVSVVLIYTLTCDRSHLLPHDDLDFILASPYDHSLEIFPEPIDVYLQAETTGKPTWRRLRNTSDLKSSLDARAGIVPRPTRPNWPEILPYKLNKVRCVGFGRFGSLSGPVADAPGDHQRPARAAPPQQRQADELVPPLAADQRGLLQARLRWQLLSVLKALEVVLCGFFVA